VLIAEIGNNHFGDFDQAKELIRVANECGADLIKSQAFRADDISQGSMPREFYSQCEFSVEMYLELIDYARSIGNDLFYSIFSPGMEIIAATQNWRKVAGSQTRMGYLTMADDADNLIVSVPITAPVPKFKKASVLHVSEYLTTSPNLWHIQTLTDHTGRQAGYSDHTIGVDACKRAFNIFGCQVIEKHFCLEKNVSFRGTVYRDTQHGATPHEFVSLAREMSK
jgi:sialic acid synthase SpsE